MFKRLIENEFNVWYKNLKYKKKVLLVRGARQVGKTTLVVDYAKKKFKNVCYFNFMDDHYLKEIFNDRTIDEILMLLKTRYLNYKFIENETVLIFDEIQECSYARYMFKPFMLDGRFDIIATGSLLGIKGYNKKEYNIPVGFEYNITMTALTFEEYLLANGISNDIIEILKEHYLKLTPVSEPLHSMIYNHYLNYICVGGMPEVVQTFMDTKDLNIVRRVQRDILEAYKDDFGKYLNIEEKVVLKQSLLTKTLEVYNSIPAQLAKENKRFQYNVVKKKARSKDYESVITWLNEYGLISICNNLSNISAPLKGNINAETFKIYVNDTGLFIAMLDVQTAGKILLNELGLYKGAIYENIVAEALIKKQIPLYYYSKSSGLEIDFVRESLDYCFIIEVKARGGKSKSAKTILGQSLAKFCIKYANANISIKDNIITLPHYMTMFVDILPKIEI